VSGTEARHPRIWWLLGDLRRREPLHLHSPFRATEVSRALCDLGLNVLPGAGEGRPLRGRVIGTRVVATRRTPINGPTNPYFIGTIEDRGPSGTELVGCLRPARPAAAVSAALTTLILVGALALVLQVGPSTISLLTAALLIVTAFGPVFLTSWIVADDWAYLRRALVDALHATEVTGDAPV